MKKRPLERDKLAAVLDPSQKLCPLFDDVSIIDFPVARPEEMGVRVLDNCCQEHIM